MVRGRRIVFGRVRALMTAAALKAWRKRLGVTQPQAAEMLGLSVRGYRNLELGARPIQRYIALACTALEAGIAYPWSSLPPFIPQRVTRERK